MGKETLNEKQIRWIVRDEMRNMFDELGGKDTAAPAEKELVSLVPEQAEAPEVEVVSISKEDIISALGKHGKTGALSILGQFNVARVGDLKVEDYADVMEVANSYEREAS